MSRNGQAGNVWGYAVEQEPPFMLRVALQALRRDGIDPVPLPGCTGERCPWVRAVAECLGQGTCRGVLLFCADPGLACCVANKVPGVRAVAVWTVVQAAAAVAGLGANCLAIEPRGRTFYELKQMLKLCCLREEPACPPGVACVLQELDGHAHR
jgi:hypothetical protein